ncbi:MAG: S1 RNA-binding domain-containing protein, partial [Phycisphaerae bacterium]
GQDGLCHISELADGYVSKVSDVCQIGDTLRVKVIAVDEQGRVKLSRKALLREEGGGEGDQPVGAGVAGDARPDNRSRGPRRDGGDRGPRPDSERRPPNRR